MSVWPFPGPQGPVPIKDQTKPRKEYPDDMPDAPYLL